MKRISFCIALLVLSGCAKKPPEPKELYDTYRSSVVLIKNSYYFKVSFDNGLEFFYYMNGEEPVMVTSEQEAIQNASSSYGTGFFISDEGEIATNRHVIYPSLYEEKVGRLLNDQMVEIRTRIRKEINSKQMQRTEAADLYNKYYSQLTHSDLNQLRNAYSGLGDEIIDLEDLLNQFNFDPSKTRYETIHLFTGVVYDDTFVNRDSDFEECVPIKKAEEEAADLAIIQLKKKKTPESVINYLSLENSVREEQLELDNKVYMIGYNQGIVLANTTNGIKTQFTSGTVTQDPDKDRVLYSIPTLQGSSGSPIIDEYGKLVAVNFAKISDYQGFSFGVPVDKLVDLHNGVVPSESGNSEAPVADSDAESEERESEVSDSEKREVPEEVNFSGNIRNLLVAEESRNFETIYSHYSATNLTRYWNVNNPGKNELKEQYERSWSITSNAKNEVQSITRLNKNAYDLHTFFTYYHVKKATWYKVDSKVRIMFDDNGKIIEIYGLESKSEELYQ